MSSKVVSQGACPKCGSSDAYTTYQDGGTHCFSCGYHPCSQVSGFVRQLKAAQDETILTLPDDISYEYSPECIEWVDQYGLRAQDLVRNKVQWSRSYNQLLFVYRGIYQNDIACIQARNFTPGKPKYYNQGDVNQVLPIYFYTRAGQANRIVLVEDAISAIKVSTDSWVDAVPLLGSHLPLHKIAKFIKLGYKEAIIWLDHDKYKEALSIADKLRYTGLEVRVVSSDLDPKCYAPYEIGKKIGLV